MFLMIKKDTYMPSYVFVSLDKKLKIQVVGVSIRYWIDNPNWIAVAM